MEEPTANELFKDYYSALTGTIAASVHGESYRWRAETEAFPYPEEAKWTDFSPYITSCNSEQETARIDGYINTYRQDLGLDTGQAQQEAINRVWAYWESRGWEVKDMTNPKNSDLKEIITYTDKGVYLSYTAGIYGEFIDTETPCIHGFFDDYAKREPAEEPITYPADKPDLDNLPAPSTTTTTTDPGATT